MKNPYETLGVASSADRDTIKRAYRKRAKKAHPDRAGGSTTEMAEINRAYALLDDPAKRAAYDAGDDPDRPRKTLDEEANALLLSAMEAVFNQLSEDDDMVKAMRSVLNGALLDHQRNVGNAECRAKKAARVLERLRGGERFEPMLRAQAAAADREVLHHNLIIERLRRAIELAQQVEWNGPQKRPTYATGPTVSVTTATRWR